VSARPGSIDGVSASADPPSLARVLAEARRELGLSLREVERRTGIRNAHLSQIETGTIARPEMALLWELSIAYGLDFARLLSLAGYEAAGQAAADRGRMTVALRALGQLTPAEQAETLEFMAELRRRREG
jgi:HTH-type transcriptional regulator, competence development regulator